jgi:acyl-CoA reductase-like NAD-dependent aldehyde dehydrogenase
MTAQTDLGVSERVQGSGYINVRCPADGRVVGNVPDMTPGQVHDVARQLRAAQPAWEDLGPDGRAKHVLRLLDWVLDNEPQRQELRGVKYVVSCGHRPR